MEPVAEASTLAALGLPAANGNNTCRYKQLGSALSFTSNMNSAGFMTQQKPQQPQQHARAHTNKAAASTSATCFSSPHSPLATDTPLALATGLLGACRVPVVLGSNLIDTNASPALAPSASTTLYQTCCGVADDDAARSEASGTSDVPITCSSIVPLDERTRPSISRCKEARSPGRAPGYRTYETSVSGQVTMAALGVDPAYGTKQKHIKR